ncbi:trehalose utilization protein ThuA [Paenibacillus psychroresistens]|uniref:Trehalose utilization protein ThuA n=1 Tax=Paenibacillus psychroresistens TaxID=1778678 RepID=A0A6B8RNI4_9BACL|nr:ThuA domain-containing protein [Paenibacillus psychroresistens]QGQ97589.1 trehalose utilization protein ThuA [Paenibacillus psychroresistens]
MNKKVKVTIWNEYRHEKTNVAVSDIYPEGIHGAIAQGLGEEFDIRIATLDDPEHGLTKARLDDTDVLLWWGHTAHQEVADEIVDRVVSRILQGMGVIFLHSAHHSKLFKKLMGTSCDLKWREVGEKERLWVIAPGHPIVAGIGDYFELEKEEMYGEFFDVPEPDQVVLLSWFEGGEVFRSGCCYTRGQGKIFYFRPGHEVYPTYHNKDVQRIIRNAAHWCAPVDRPPTGFGNAEPLEVLAANKN